MTGYYHKPCTLFLRRIWNRKIRDDAVYVPIELQQPNRVGSFYVIVENDGTVTMSH